MPHRDPETGQFTGKSHSYSDIEVVTFAADIGVEASEMSGATGFSGGDVDSFEAVQAVDFDEIVDRNEELRLLQAQHRLSSYVNSTSTADGTVAVSAEVSASPALSQPTLRAVSAGTGGVDGGPAVGTADVDDTIDIVGRPLAAVAHAPYTDGSSGTGGAGSAGEDQYESAMFPAEFGRFHPRDELFVNGRFVAWNIDDSGVHLALTGQHVYGVLDDC